MPAIVTIEPEHPTCRRCRKAAPYYGLCVRCVVELEPEAKREGRGYCRNCGHLVKLPAFLCRTCKEDFRGEMLELARKLAGTYVPRGFLR